MLRTFVHDLQDRFLGALGGASRAREPLVNGMLLPKAGERAGYWLQLAIATMLATLGLALDSTAVVIGAMLIAPLMKPLVELAMGLATGSAELVLRAVARTFVSISVVVLVAVTITWLLPFHEITAQIEARTTPSLLDLAIAAACALAAAYATMRADADMATTAAGTSIGISLVPPLCASGYGLALGDFSVARGAALLFTANLSGILVVATLAFAIAGYGRVALHRGDRDSASALASGVASRAGRAWSRVVGRRLGAFARIVPPLVLLAIVFVPLQHAVVQIQRRAAIQRAMAELLGGDHQHVMQYTVHQNASGVSVRVLVVGNAAAATTVKGAIGSRLAELGVAAPQLVVWAVPDAASVSALAHRFDELPPPPVPEPAPDTVHRYASDLAAAITAAWPSAGTGAVVAVRLDVEHPDRVRVAHLGAPIGVPAVELLARVLEPSAGHLELVEDALSPVDAEPADAARWWTQAIELATRTRRVGGLRLCVTIPKLDEVKAPATHVPPEPADVTVVRAALASWLVGAPDVTQIEGERWQIEAVRGACSPAVTR